MVSHNRPKDPAVGPPLLRLYRQAHHALLGGYTAGEYQAKLAVRQAAFLTEAASGRITGNLALLKAPSNVKADGQFYHPSPARRLRRLFNPHLH